MHRLWQYGLGIRHPLLLGVMVIALSACSSGDSKEKKGSFDPEAKASILLNAATGPLEDLNLRRQEIPPLLKKVAIYPYILPPKADCAMVQDELAQLDELLGPDLTPKEVEVAMNDTGMLSEVHRLENFEIPETEKIQDELLDRGQNMTQDAIVSFIRDKTNVLPFRSIIRRITGADRHQKAMTEAYQAGKLRRAYLKGLAESKFGKRCVLGQKPPVHEI